MKKVLAISLLAILMVSTIVAATPDPLLSTGMISARSVLCRILYNIRMLLSFIAAAVAAVVITLQGLKWAGSAEDPGARKQAKQGMIHAVIGLIIVLLAIWIVTMIFTADTCDAI
ncbi:hypothetical protein ACFLRF_03665 [Candidatus Altiarchaeota archaeon]